MGSPKTSCVGAMRQRRHDSTPGPSALWRWGSSSKLAHALGAGTCPTFSPGFAALSGAPVASGDRGCEPLYDCLPSTVMSRRNASTTPSHGECEAKLPQSLQSSGDVGGRLRSLLTAPLPLVDACCPCSIGGQPRSLLEGQAQPPRQPASPLPTEPLPPALWRVLSSLGEALDGLGRWKAAQGRWPYRKPSQSLAAAPVCFDSLPQGPPGR
mmetsp:Transcript_53729/g.125245  ORF Transcript_53729/g.125245 Transcript_53729/m.125245 type:complete len:211 (-) Transcript_53729:125-757(-)